MGNARQSSTISVVLNFGDMTVLAILILVIFGPDRMPELARKAGTMLAKARDTVRVLREDLGTEYKEILEPIEDVRKTLKEARSEIRGIASEVAHQVGSAVDDVKAEVTSVSDEAKSSVDQTLADARKAVQLDKPQSPGGPGDLPVEEPLEEVSGESDEEEPPTDTAVLAGDVSEDDASEPDPEAT
jgi:sec-independent protein translocase protein TatB